MCIGARLVLDALAELLRVILRGLGLRRLVCCRNLVCYIFRGTHVLTINRCELSIIDLSIYFIINYWNSMIVSYMWSITKKSEVNRRTKRPSEKGE